MKIHKLNLKKTIINCFRLLLEEENILSFQIDPLWKRYYLSPFSPTLSEKTNCIFQSLINNKFLVKKCFFSGLKIASIKIDSIPKTFYEIIEKTNAQNFRNKDEIFFVVNAEDRKFLNCQFSNGGEINFPFSIIKNIFKHIDF